MTARRAIGALLALLWAASAIAHEVRPGYLELIEGSPNTFSVVWKVPTQGEYRLPLDALFPSHCSEVGEVQRVHAAGYLLERRTVSCEQSLIGGTITITNLEVTLTDVLVRIEFADGTSRTTRLGPSNPSFEVPVEPSLAEVARSYLVLGVEHILGGIDHLMFVLALLMIVSGVRRLLYTVTAFTLAHSMTLALATLGFVHVPSAPVEAVIALSILFLAREAIAALKGGASMTVRRPWIVAFAFGLLHGFGFAGALAEAGLPQSAIPVALLLFNVGVEIGQALFIGVALLLWAGVSRVSWSPPEWARAVPAYGIGSVAAYWTIERVLSFWG